MKKLSIAVFSLAGTTILFAQAPPDVSAIYPLGDRRYAVHHRGEPFSREPRYTAQEAAAVIVARMPETWGPAVAGTQHDLRERESQ